MNENHVQSLFQTIAPKYDLMNWVISLGLHRLWRNRAVSELGIKSGAKVLDICCGTASWTVKLAREVGPEGKVVGVDFSPRMLEIGRQKVDDLGLKQVELKQGNALNLKFDRNTFDYVTTCFGLRNVAEIETVLAEMKRVVKSGGVVASFDLSKPQYKSYRMLFLFYVSTVVPVLGKVITDNYQEYSWLPKSLREFPDRERLAVIFKQLGFQQVEANSFGGGVVALHVGKND
jgi:demethylmenaquinone methyltransferase/2-methoxy-6-polyprenyl-1,4-benzoquinol methylase